MNNNNNSADDDDVEVDDYVRRRNQGSLSNLGHALVRLSAANTRELLLVASELPERRRAEADAICARLAELNPDVARHFQPKQTAISRLKLRMLVPADAAAAAAAIAPIRPPDGAVQDGLVSGAGAVSGQDKTTSPLRIDSFIVVSYCWHYPEWHIPGAASPIASDWEISQPMVDKVMRLARVSSAGGVWLDKLCINQADEDDKITHVGAMDMIYRSARRVVILLEDVQLDNSDQELAALAYRGFYQDMCDYVKEHDLEGMEKAVYVQECFPRMEREWCERSAALSGSHGDEQGEFDTRRLQAAAKQFIFKMLSARWFTRAWCAHESRVSKHGKVNNPLFLCFGPPSSHDDDKTGSGSITTTATTTTTSSAKILDFEFRVIHYMALYLSELPPDEDDPAPPPLADMVNMQAAQLNDESTVPKDLWQLWTRMQRLMPDSDDHGCSAMQHLVSVLSFGCTFKGDLMSIALNTSSIPLVFRGTAETAEDVIWIFALLVLAAGDVVPLVADGGKLRFLASATATGEANHQGGGEAQSSHLISWAPRTTQGVLDATLPLPHKSSITSITRDFIELDMLVFKPLPAAPTPASQTRAANFISKFQLDAVADLYAAAADGETQRNSEIMAAVISRIKEGQPDGPLHVFVKTWIAHALDSGKGWMLRLPEVMRRDTQDWMHGVLGEVEDETLLPAAREILGMMADPNATTTTTTTTTPDSDGITDATGEEASQEASHPRSPPSSTEEDQDQEDDETVRLMALSLRTILDPRLKFYTASPRRLPTSTTTTTSSSSSADHAMTFISSNTAYIAIPLALASLPSWHKRAWVVEPFDPASDKPETLADFLPDPARTCIQPGERIEDVYPVLSSDYADRRRPIPQDGDGVGAGAWRLRRREQIFGFQGLAEDILEELRSSGGCSSVGQDGEGEGHVVYLEKQRVYGAEDYDWGAIHDVAKRIEGNGAGEASVEEVAPETAANAEDASQGPD